MKDARSEACVSLRFVSHSPENIGTSFVHKEFASPMMAAIQGVSNAPPTIAMMSPAAPSLCALWSIPPRAMPYIVGNISDMKPDIAMRQMTFAENGSPWMVKRTFVGRYITPAQQAMAANANAAIIEAGFTYFIANVAIQRQAMNVDIAIR